MAVTRFEAELFRRRKREEEDWARQLAALRLACGIDLETALAASGPERDRAILRLGRKLRQERLKALNGHWSYDLNRHIALAQALERLLAAHGGMPAAAAAGTQPARAG